MELSDFFADNPQAALAFSGGVDSSFLLYAGMRWGKRVKAYYVRTPFQPEFEYRDALRLARELNAQMEVITRNVLELEEVTANPPDRCYHCKKAIFSAIAEKAREDGFSLLLDGTNASDQEDDRPGMRALRELSVRSPLRECGLTKDAIRELSRQAGLFTWDKPAYACLATRIPTGTPITVEMLSRTEWAEDYLMRLGFTDFRVRTLGNAAKLQLKPEQMAKLMGERYLVLYVLEQYFDEVYLDLKDR